VKVPPPGGNAGARGSGPGGEALDDRIRDAYLEAWQEAADGAYGLWLCSARGTLAYLVLTDQLPRNMFRGKPEAFSTDRMARAAARSPSTATGIFSSTCRRGRSSTCP